MKAEANVRKGQPYMSYKSEHHTLTKQSMRQQISPSDNCHTTISMKDGGKRPQQPLFVTLYIIIR